MLLEHLPLPNLVLQIFPLGEVPAQQSGELAELRPVAAQAVERPRVVPLESLAEDFSDGGISSLVDVLRSRTDSWGRSGAVYLLADASLAPLAGNLTAWPRDVKPQGGSEVRFLIETREGDATIKHRIWARVEQLPDGYWLLVGTDTSDSDRAMRRFGWATVWAMGLITALFGVLGWWYSRQTARRVRAFTSACDSIVHSDLSRRLAGGLRGDEFDQLSSTVNDMLNRIEQLYANDDVTSRTYGLDGAVKVVRLDRDGDGPGG
jgi:methyl-accepting chemotaxis protein